MKTNSKANTKRSDGQSKTSKGENSVQGKTTYESMAGILERISDGFVAFDREMNFTYINERGGDLLGRKPEELIGKNYWKEYPEAEGSIFANAYVRALETQTSIQMEDYYEPWDRWFENRIYPSQDGLSIFFRDITEQKRSEETLRENEARYRSIFETSGVSIWEEDFSEVKAALDELKSQGVSDFRKYFSEHPDFVLKAVQMLKIIDVNEMTLRLYGAKYKNELLRSFETIQGPTNIETFTDEFISLAEGKTYFEGEVMDQTLQGEPLYLWRTIVFPKDTAGFKSVLVSLTNITARKQAEEALKQSEERFRALTENNWNAIALFSADGSILYGSPSTSQVLGYSLDEFVGRHAFELIHKDDQAFVTERLTLSLQQPGAHINVYARVLHKNGTWRWLEGVFTNLLDKPSVQAIVNNYHDFTERKQAEEKLRESEDQFRQFAENIEDVIWMSDARHSGLIYANPSYERVWGRPLVEPLKNMSTYMQAIHPEDREKVTAMFRLPPEERIGAHEYRIVRPDNTIRWIRDRAFAIRDSQGKMLRIAGIAEDITERKQAESLQSAIYQISEAANQTDDMDELFRSVHRIIGQVMQVQNFYIALYDPENDLLSFPYYVDEVDGSASIPATRPGRGMTEYVLRTGKPLLSDAANFEDLVQRGEVELIGPLSPIWVGAPLVVEGRTIGVIALQDYADPNVYTERELRILEYVSRQVAVAIERTRLNSDIQRRNQILFALQESTLVLMERQRLTDVLQAIVAQIVQLMDTPNGFLYLVEPDGKNLKMHVGMGISSQRVGIKLRLGEGLAGKIWNTGQSLVVQDYHTWAGRSRQFEEFEIYAMAGVPLTAGSQTIGVLGVDYLDSSRTISQEDVDLLTRFAQLASLAIENARSYQTAKDELNERIRAEVALVEAEAKYRSLVERLPVVVYTSELGIAGIWHYVSPQIESLLGFTQEEWMADPNLWYQQIHPDDQDRQKTLEEQAYLRGESFDAEYRIHKRDGQELWVRDTAHILSPRDGGLPIVQGVLVDITERKLAEEAFHASEETTRLIIDTALDAVITIDQDGYVIRWNDQAEVIFGWMREEAVGQRLSTLVIPPDLRASHEQGLKHYLETGEGPVLDKRIEITAQRQNGDIFPVELTIHVLKANDGVSFAAFVRDITERKQAEENLRAAEAKYRMLVEHISAITYTAQLDDTKSRIYVSPQIETLLGYSQAEYLADANLWKKMLHPDDQPRVLAEAAHFYETGEPFVSDYRSIARDGHILWFHDEAVIVEDETSDRRFIQGVKIDITALKQAEEALGKAHDDLEQLVQERTAELAQANTLLQTMLDHVPDHIFFKDLQGRFIRNSRSQAEMLGLSDPAQAVGKSDFDFFPHAQQAYDEEQSIIKSGQPMVDFEEHVRWPDGRETWVSTTKVPLRDEAGQIVGTFGIARDITGRKRADETLRKAKDELEVRVAERTAELNKTNEQLRLELGERRQAEENLRAAEARYRSLVEQLPGIVYTNPADDLSSTVYVSPQVKTFLGYSQEEWLEDSKFWRKLLHPEDRPRVLAEVEHANESGELLDVEYRMISRDNLTVWFRDQAALLRNSNGHSLLRQGLMIDITDRKQAEEALKSSETRYRLASRATNDVIWDLDIVNDLHTWNENVLSLSGYAAEEVTSNAKWWHEHIHPADRERVLSGLKAFYESRDTIWADEYRFLRRDGSIAYITDRGYVERDVNGNPLRMIGAMSDISARKLAEDQIRRRVDHLKALRMIDMTITSSTDLHFSLQTLLKQAISQLQVDAVDILLLNPATHILEYSVGMGFYTKAVERSSVRIGEGFAGRAALERKIVSIHSLYESRESFTRKLLLDGEDFTGYYGVPLIAKGEVKGVLEVFHRTHIEADQEWVDFLESIAGQAGLAIDNATLFQNLQRTNLELGIAYESTLEGWSAALDLRDKETEGHTLRVTNLTLQLAEHMGLKEKNLLYIRRGALLHDIGKMGVPDRILLKPDNLTSEEWEIMKFHPAYAYEMLSRIEYLRPSLDIPYCHHEKWDGTGYPRGLKGEEIPLHARIFAVVDVYDALTSDRPYRSAWTKERTVEYIKSLSGAHFDPRVVSAFLELLSQNR